MQIKLMLTKFEKIKKYGRNHCLKWYTVFNRFFCFIKSDPKLQMKNYFLWYISYDVNTATEYKNYFLATSQWEKDIRII